ncbi:MAG: hypothetical protein GXY34_05580 [Syntrophomonadaceae bacterium]|jgi:hypothetical protein|nr:hypothetical protein [Syntrophomonadaceae bacterium]
MTDKSIIEAAIKETYLKVCGESEIGLPTNVVNYWDRESSSLLVQHFQGGSEERSAIILEDGTYNSYVLPGNW